MAANVWTATFTPAATSHNGGDAVGAAARFETAANIDGRPFTIKTSSLQIADATVVSSVFTLYFYSITPPSAYADDAAWDIPSGDRASFLGSLVLGTPVDLGTTQYVETVTHNKIIDLPAGSTGLWAYLVITTTSTLTASAYTVKLGVETSN
jgi:hypothetical protein